MIDPITFINVPCGDETIIKQEICDTDNPIETEVKTEENSEDQVIVKTEKVNDDLEVSPDDHFPPEVLPGMNETSAININVIDTNFDSNEQIKNQFPIKKIVFNEKSVKRKLKDTSIEADNQTKNQFPIKKIVFNKKISPTPPNILISIAPCKSNISPDLDNMSGPNNHDK